jgi:hypothetical protein
MDADLAIMLTISAGVWIEKLVTEDEKNKQALD